MSWFKNFRALALSAALAAAPVLPSVPEAPASPAKKVSTDALFSRFEARPKLTSAAFDAGRLNDLFGDTARLTWTEAGPDKASGAYRLAGARLEQLGDEPKTLFTADEVLLWNADIDAFSARMNGERLGETIRVFDRIEVSGLKLDMTDYSNAVDDAVTSAFPTADAALGYDEASMNTGRLILSGLTLHPWTLEQVEGEDEDLASIRLVSALLRSFSLDATVFLDTSISQAFTEGGTSGTIVSSYDRQIVEGYDRGNIGSMVQTGLTFSGSIPVPVDESDPNSALVPLDMAGSSAYGAWTGVSFAKLLEYGERGEMPPITARDLISLGKYTLADTEMTFGGKPFFDIGRMEFQADEFAWFLPERIVMSHEDVSLNLADFVEVIAAFEPETQTEDGEPSIAEMASILNRTGFGRLSGDGSMTLAWNSETGAARLENTSTTDGLYGNTVKFDLRLPSYAEVAPAFGPDGKSFDETMMDQVFEDTFAFIGGHYSLTDTGLLNAAASLVIEIAKISGEEDQVLSNFAESTPETVRMFASGMVMFGGGAASQEVPQANQWLTSLSQFITSGGTFSVDLAPTKPLTAADFTGAGPDAGMVESPSTAEMVDLLGVKVTHTPPG